MSGAAEHPVLRRPSAGASIADSLSTPAGQPTAADIQTAHSISLRSGEPISEIARGIALDRVRDGGMKVLGILARLTKALVRDKLPDQLKLPFALWTRKAVAQLIKARYALRLPVRTLSEYLKRWGFTPQKPIKKAYEQQPQA